MLKPAGMNCDGRAILDEPIAGTPKPITPAKAIKTINPIKKDNRI